MSLFHALRHRFAILVNRDAYERELADEMRFHLALDAEDDQRNGVPPGAAHEGQRAGSPMPTRTESDAGSARKSCRGEVVTSPQQASLPPPFPSKASTRRVRPHVSF